MTPTKLKRIKQARQDFRSRPRNEKRRKELWNRWYNLAYPYKGACVDPDPYMDPNDYWFLSTFTDHCQRDDFQASSKLYNPSTLTFIKKDQEYYHEGWNPISWISPDWLNKRWGKANQKAIENYNKAQAERGR